MLHCDVSLVVRIVAFQAVDPGSSPGRRNLFDNIIIENLEVGLNKILHCDVSLVVRIVAFQAVDPGSSPGRRNLFNNKIKKVFILY